mgnify:CR=1 FL=1
MRKIAILLGLMISFGASAQNSNEPLPVNTKIKKGVLANGMTYYIYNTDVTKDVASYYIIQNVGSVLEKDNQQGLAHFLEHMAFNGTENFAGKGILNTMQKHGLVFGRDINAYTSFDETVYNIDNIPSTPEMIKTGLMVLKDWSNYLLLTDEEIDAERGVIKEEWRTRQSGGMRILKQSLPTMFNNSAYSNRMPIGLMDIIDNFEYKALRDFYHDWYRTDLQAIAIVGDIDVDDIEKQIKAMFSEIPAVKNPIERVVVEIPNNKEMLYNMAMDDEVTTASISFGINHPKSLKDQTVADLKESLLNGMATSMLSSRLREISQKPDAPFLGARIGYRSLARAKNQFSASISPKPDMQQAAFKLAMEEISRAVKFGFTNAEISRVKADFSSYYENQISKLEDRSHGAIVNTIKNNYLKNASITDINLEYQVVKFFFSKLTQADLLAQIQKLYTKNNRTIVVTGVEGNKNLTKEEAISIINKVENDKTLKGYAEETNVKSLMSGVDLKEGSITSEEENKEIGSTVFTLSNGIKVHYKFADKNKNDVSLMAYSYGGQSLLADDDLPSAALMGGVIQSSGLGEFSSIDLRKVLAGKKANSRVSVGNISENVSGSSSTKDVETMMQLVNLRFTKPRFDENAYKVLMQNVSAFLIRKSEQIQSKMQDSVTTILYGKNHPTRRLFDKEFVAEVSFNKMKNIYKSRFGNAGDFTFFIVGDVTKETIKPLLTKYIASLQTTNDKENWKDNSTDWINDKIDQDVFLEMKDPKTSVRVVVKNDIEYSLKNSLLMRTLGDILQLRYTESLREEEGGTYGASAYASVSKRPTEKANIWVQFDCNPDKVEKLVAIAHNEILKISKGEISLEDISKIKNNLIKENTQQQDYNRFDMNRLKTYFREGYDNNSSKNFEDIINSIDVNLIKTFTRNLLKDANSYEIIIKPNNK